MMFDITKKERIKKFWDFLLDNLRITDTVFHYHKTKFIIVLEETSIRRALLLNDSIRKKIKKCWCKFKFYSSAIQWDPMEDTESIIKALRKRLKKAKANKRTDFIHSLSRMN
jgi:PleD family two-component response regulator